MPVVEYYEKQGKLAKISAVPTPDEVSISQSLRHLFQSISTALKAPSLLRHHQAKMPDHILSLQILDQQA